MRRFLLPAIATTLLLAGLSAEAQSKRPALFRAQQVAQLHCQVDTVVWLDLPTGTYFLPGQRGYAGSKTGAFVCRKEAEAAGDKPAKR